MYTSQENESLERRRRRTHSPQLKAELVLQCQQVGVSVAAVAMEHGINPNLLRRWLTEHERLGQHQHAALPSITPQRDVAAQFIALPLTRAQPPESQAPVEQFIMIDLQRNGLMASVRWPIGQAQECAAWLCDVMR